MAVSTIDDMLAASDRVLADVQRVTREIADAPTEEHAPVEPVIKVAFIVELLAELEGLARDVTDAAAQFGAAIDAVAKEAKCKPGALRRFIKARISDKPSKARAEAEQLVLLFEGLGT